MYHHDKIKIHVDDIDQYLALYAEDVSIHGYKIFHLFFLALYIKY